MIASVDDAKMTTSELTTSLRRRSVADLARIPTGWFLRVSPVGMALRRGHRVARPGLRRRRVLGAPAVDDMRLSLLAPALAMPR